MTDKEKQEWAEIRDLLADTRTELDNLREEMERGLQELQSIADADDEDVENPHWLAGVNFGTPSETADSGKMYRLPDDYPAPREILRSHFPRTADQCNFSGGWGYDAEHAVTVKEFDPEINPDEHFDGISLEYAFIDKRIREELILSRPEGERFAGLSYNTLSQQLLDIKGVPHDCLIVEVTAYPEKEWEELKADWETHDGFKDDPEGRERNLARKNACKITYQTEYYFDISDFFMS